MQTRQASVSELLRQAALRWPGNEAVVCGEDRLDYRAFDRLVDAVAAGLVDLGVEPGDHVAVVARNSLPEVTTHLALNRLGAVAALFNPQVAGPELVQLFERTHPRAIVFDVALAGVMEEVREGIDYGSPEWIAIGDEAPGFARTWRNVRDGASGPVRPATLPGDAPSVMMFTSGTTGLPKAVVVERAAEYLNTLLMVAELGLTARDRNLNIAPLFHAAPWGCHFLPHLAVGAANIVVPRFDAKTLPDLLRTEAVTTLLGVPTHFELASGADWGHGPPPDLRLVCVTGAPVRRRVLDWIGKTLTDQIFNIYGLTEATTLITICPPSEIWRSGDDPCIGRALLGMEVRLRPLEEPTIEAALDRQDEVVSGELVCRGPKLMTGYYRQEDKTRERLRNGWLYSGDICHKDADGYLYLTDRQDNLIITGGEKVYPSEIEAALNANPMILDSVVAGVPDDTWGERIEAFVVPASSSSSEQAVLQSVKDGWRLSHYKRPRHITLIDAVPRNPSGKVLRRVLLARYGEGSTSKIG